jgi:two-component system, cell cycle sensor histidine kinase and response regulator CckA
MNLPPQYVYFVRLASAMVATCGFFLLSVYTRSRTEHNVFPILFPAVVLSAWLGGRAGGLISTILLSISTAYYHMPPQGLAVGDPDDLVRLGTFTLSGAFVAWMSGALKESHVILLATLRSIGDAVIATDRRGSVRFLNPVAETLTGWEQKDAKGRPLADVFQGFDADSGTPLQLPAPDQLRAVVSLSENICLTSKSGAQVFIDDSIAPVRIDSGRALGSILVFRDATRRRQNEAALVESERQRLQAQRMEAIGRFAGGVAHDFNNLLTVINGYADLLLRQNDQSSRSHDGIEQIRKAGEQAALLTRQLLVFSRGKPMKIEVVDLNQIVANFEKMLRRLIGEDIQLATRLAPEPLYVRADVGQVEQIIMNLAVNARDAMPGGGRLTIETGVEPPDVNRAVPGETSAEYAVLTVTDTGVGIEPEVKAHIFEPFFTTKDPGKGTGLGLAIIHGIVKRHNGYMRVESDPGKGSAFAVYLPRTEIARELQSAASPHEPSRGTATILLVEDSEDVRALMREVLTGLGYIVIEAADAQEAVHAVAEHSAKIDLMVSDIVMPGMGGLDLAKHLAQSQPRMRVLFVSGYADQETAGLVLNDPATGYLQKPFGPADLARKVAEMIARAH